VTRFRDRLVAGIALAVLVAAGIAVSFMVRNGQQAGIDAREELRLELIQTLGRELDTRVQQAFTQFTATAGAPGAWTLRPGDPADAAKMSSQSGTATSGPVLVDRNATIVNGPLLVEPDAIGSTYRRDDLQPVFEGESAMLPVGQGVTTTHAILGIAIPVRSTDGEVNGAYIYESPVTADSAFSQEIAQLRAGETGTFSIIDASGMVVASTDEATLAERTKLPQEVLRPGFRHADGNVYAAASIPSADWIYVFEQSSSEFQGDLTRPLQGALLAIVLLIVLGGIFSVVALTRRLRAAREEQRRLAEISVAREEFASIVSHELRTPVAGLLGFLQTTIDHWDAMSDDERRRAIDRALDNAERLQHLSADVLETSALDAGSVELRTEVVNLRAFVDDTALTTGTAFADREVRVTGDEQVAVSADLPRLRQVLGNVLDNAVKNSPPDTPIEVTVERVDGEGRVSVRDHGSGIAVDDRERIFDKYTRAGASLSRGTGLGLYLARQIVQAHGGRIWVADTQGPGTTIVFSLPAREGDRG
jgi:signal transduction histidine kinase